MTLFFIIIGLIMYIPLARRYISCEKPFKTAFICMGSGSVTLIALSIILSYMGETLAVNLFTSSVCVGLGPAGAVLLAVYTLLT